MPKEQKQAKPVTRRYVPPITPEDQEDELIFLATRMAEEQLRNKTASAQVLTHYLKLGSSREKLEQERIKNENILMQAKAEAIESSKRVEELYIQALDAMRAYGGVTSRADDDYED